MGAALDPALLATDLADYLVRKGVPFRTSHEVVGRVVRRAEALGCSIAELSAEALAEEHEAFGPGVTEVFDPVRSADARVASGSTSREAVAAQLEQAREALGAGLW